MPAQFYLGIAYGGVPQKTKHFASLQWQRKPKFWMCLCEVPCNGVTWQMAMLIVSTAQGTREARFFEPCSRLLRSGSHSRAMRFAIDR